MMDRKEQRIQGDADQPDNTLHVLRLRGVETLPPPSSLVENRRLLWNGSTGAYQATGETVAFFGLNGLPRTLEEGSEALVVWRAAASRYEELAGSSGAEPLVRFRLTADRLPGGALQTTANLIDNADAVIQAVVVVDFQTVHYGLGPYTDPEYGDIVYEGYAIDLGQPNLGGAGVPGYGIVTMDGHARFIEATLATSGGVADTFVYGRVEEFWGGEFHGVEPKTETITFVGGGTGEFSGDANVVEIHDPLKTGDYFAGDVVRAEWNDPRQRFEVVPWNRFIRIKGEVKTLPSAADAPYKIDSVEALIGISPAATSMTEINVINTPERNDLVVGESVNVWYDKTVGIDKFGHWVNDATAGKTSGMCRIVTEITAGSYDPVEEEQTYGKGTVRLFDYESEDIDKLAAEIIEIHNMAPVIIANNQNVQWKYYNGRRVIDVELC